MAEYKDQRAVGDDFIQDLNNDEILGEFTQFVKNHQAEFQMCFRGNGENEKVIIYKNNHAFWTITKNKDKNNRKYKISVSFNHARYCSNWEDLKNKLVDKKYDFKNKELTKDGISEISTEFKTSFSKEFVQGTYEIINEIFGKFFEYKNRTDNCHLEKDYFKSCYNKTESTTNKNFLAEKIMQQKLFTDIFIGGENCFAYDLEFSQKYPNKEYKKTNNIESNQPDMLGIRDTGNGFILVFIEVKSLKSACQGDSGVLKHLNGMLKYIDEDILGQKVIENRKKDACKIIDAYKKLGLREYLKNTTKDEFIGTEILFVFTDTNIDAKYNYDAAKNTKDIPATQWIANTDNQNKLKAEIAKHPEVTIKCKTYIDGKLNDVIP